MLTFPTWVSTDNTVQFMCLLLLYLWYIALFEFYVSGYQCFLFASMYVKPERFWLLSKSVNDCVVNIVIMSVLYHFSQFLSTLSNVFPMYNILVFPYSTVEFISSSHAAPDHKANPLLVSPSVAQHPW